MFKKLRHFICSMASFPIRKHTSPMLVLLLFLHFIYLYQIHVGASMGGFYFNLLGISLIILSFVPVACMYYILQFGFNKKPRLIIVSILSLLFLYGLGASYHFESKTQFLWSVFLDNSGNLFFKESLGYILGTLDKDTLYYLVLLMGIFIYNEWRNKSISRYGKQQLSKPVILSLLIYTVFITSTLPVYDPISAFIKSCYVYYKSPPISIKIEPNTFPLKQEDKLRYDFISVSKTPQRPHIFLVIVESLNHSVLHKKTELGQEITPFLNQLEDTSVYVDQFYGNSIQSARGQLAVLFSILPNINQKVATKYPKTQLKSIATILNEINYQAIFFKHPTKRFR